MTDTTLHIPTLETERFILRAPGPQDLDAYAAFCASPRSAFVGGPYNRDQAFQRLCSLIGHWAIRGYGRWMVTERETGTALGVVGPMYPESWPEPEIAWSVFDNAEGRGVAIEAATAARDWLYKTMGWATVISCVDPDNTRSLSVAQRMGCVQDGCFQHEVFGILHIWRHPAADEVAA